MTPPLRLAIAGCGDMARYVATLLRFNRHVRVSACCDQEQESAGRFARRHAIPAAYADYGAMLEREPLDAVYIAVPHDLHLEFARLAIERGRHVLLEKPLARTLAEGEEIVRLASAAFVRVGVNYQYRYDSGCYALAQAARSGNLGDLYYARCHVPWHRDDTYFRQGPWRGQAARAGGGTLLTQGSHLLDILLWAFDARPVAALGVTARRRFKAGPAPIDVEDVAQSTVEVEGGGLLQVCSAMVAAPEQAVTVEIYGARGTALYTDRPWPHVRFRGLRLRPARPPVRGLHALQRSLEAFRRWIVDGTPYLTPAASALPVLAAVDAIYRSAASGRREALGLPSFPSLTQE